MSTKKLTDCNYEKAVDNPKVRWKDPACWSCLSDEQRDIINEWYMDRLVEDKEFKKSKEKHECNIRLLGIIPSAVLCTYLYGKHNNSALRFFLNLLCFLFVNFVICALTWQPADELIPLDFDSKADKVWRYSAVTLGVLAFSITIIGRFFYHN